MGIDGQEMDVCKPRWGAIKRLCYCREHAREAEKRLGARRSMWGLENAWICGMPLPRTNIGAINRKAANFEEKS